MADSRFGPTHVVITGASQGLGRALAEGYAAPGRRLTLLARSRAPLEEAAAVCAGKGAVVTVDTADVTDAVAMAERVTAADDRQPIDLIIANAGVGGLDAVAGPDGEAPTKAALMANVNFCGVINTITPALPRLVARRAGRIAIIGSIAGLVPLPSSPAYSASKAAVRFYGIALDRLVRSNGVRVTVVSPGFVHTAMSASLPMRLAFPVSAQRAADIIIAGIAAGRREIVFPWQLRLSARVVSLLPDAIAAPLLAYSEGRYR